MVIDTAIKLTKPNSDGEVVVEAYVVEEILSAIRDAVDNYYRKNKA